MDGGKIRSSGKSMHIDWLLLPLFLSSHRPVFLSRSLVDIFVILPIEFSYHHRPLFNHPSIHSVDPPDQHPVELECGVQKWQMMNRPHSLVSLHF